MHGNETRVSIIAAILAAGVALSVTACSSGQTSDTNNTVNESDNVVTTVGDAVTEPDVTTAEETEMLPEIGAAVRLPQGEKPLFANVSVHDPSVTKVGDTYYIIGSHMQAAKSSDLIKWVSVSTGADNTPLFKSVKDELANAIQWTQTELYWAADWIQLRADGKFYMYYCVSQGSSPLSCIGLAVADNMEGPYTDLGVIIRSGVSGFGPDGASFNANTDPNAIDPQAFYDKDGNMWLVYGSYSGGIYITELDPATGRPKAGQRWGTKLTGGSHTPIEGAYIMYSPETDYYYLFTSFGGLSYNDGYNLRVSRSKSPDGPYVDYAGQDMIHAADGSTTAFDTSKIQNYGLKLFGNHVWQTKTNDTGTGKKGYVSPGHNSAYYDAETGRYFLIFHTRFPGEGEVHQVRVHQMFMNEDGWPVVAPCRYAGETIGEYVGENIIGKFKYVNHGHEVTNAIVKSSDIELNADYTITKSGTKIGEWSLKNGNLATITIDGVTYKGVFLYQWDDVAGAYTMTFTAASEGGVSIWGTQIYEP